MKKIKIVCLGGSMEGNSSTLALLKYSVIELNNLGAETYLADIKNINLPIFSYNNLKKLKNKRFDIFLEKIKEADGFLFVSPEYHGTVSSAFKNIIDYLEILSDNDPPYLTMKPVGCIAIGGAENAGFPTLSTMINIVHNLRAVAAPSSFTAGFGSMLFNQQGEIKGNVILKKVNRLVSELYTMAFKLKA